MMVFLWIIVILLLVLFILFWMILKAFKNPVRLHDKTPEDLHIPFTEITIPTKNNCSLYGWWIPGKDKVSFNYPGAWLGKECRPDDAIY